MIFGGEVMLQGVTLEPQRPTFDDMGNVTALGDLDPIEDAVVILSPPSPMSDLVSQWGQGSQYTLDGLLFTPRGAGMRNGDRFSYQGRVYDVISDAQWDMVHPMTGDDYGYVMYTIRWAG